MVLRVGAASHRADVTVLQCAKALAALAGRTGLSAATTLLDGSLAGARPPRAGRPVRRRRRHRRAGAAADPRRRARRGRRPKKSGGPGETGADAGADRARRRRRRSPSCPSTSSAPSPRRPGPIGWSGVRSGAVSAPSSRCGAGSTLAPALPARPQSTWPSTPPCVPPPRARVGRGAACPRSQRRTSDARYASTGFPSSCSSSSTTATRFTPTGSSRR